MSFGEVHALRGISFEVPRGTVLGLLGPNGAGKTTAVRILTTILQPTSGSAWVNGIDVVADPHAVRACMLGGPTASKVLIALAWTVGITVVVAPTAIRRYRNV
jgi:ABC-type multidrug transport system ATPase subunit